MDQALQLLIGGLVVGSIYGLIGIAFTGVYTVTGVVNFAQGDLAMIGAMIGAAAVSLGLAEPIAILIGILSGAILGIALFRFGIQPLKGNLVGAVIVTIGFGIALQGMAVAIWGTDAQTLPAFSGETPIRDRRRHTAPASTLGSCHRYYTDGDPNRVLSVHIRRACVSSIFGQSPCLAVVRN